MSDVLEVPEAGIVVMRAHIETELASAYAAECESIFMQSNDDLAISRGAKSPGEVNTLRLLPPEASLDASQYPAVVEVLRRLKLMQKTLAINYQQPLSSQKFHSDLFKKIPLTIIYPNGFGAFDYAPQAQSAEEAEQQHETVDLAAGDVMLHSLPYLKHRGRNKESKPRITTVSY